MEAAGSGPNKVRRQTKDPGSGLLRLLQMFVGGKLLNSGLVTIICSSRLGFSCQWKSGAKVHQCPHKLLPAGSQRTGIDFMLYVEHV